MPRRSLSWIRNRCCYHVTQRCQERRYLLRFKKDRRQYLQRLQEATERHAVSVLNYMVTSNHVHLLLIAEQAAHVSSALQYVSGSIAQDYNRRKERQGAFWSGRYRPTLIQPGHHLSRCFFYISMNMVRARAVAHPCEWVGGSHAELLEDYDGESEPIIDRPALLKSMHCGSWDLLRDWYLGTLEQQCRRKSHPRQPLWTEAAAVGDEDWIEDLAATLPRSWRKVEYVPATEGGIGEIGDGQGTYVMHVSKRRREGLLAALH